VRQEAVDRATDVNGTACRDYGPGTGAGQPDNPSVTGSGPARGAWLAVVAVNAVLAVGAAFVLVPWLILLAVLLAGLGMGSVDPTIVDDGLGPWMVAALAGAALYAAVALSVNLLVVRRTRLRGRPWLLVAALVTVSMAGPLAVYLTPGLW
jgi:uncharacterized membrane protein SirB2